MKRVTKYLYVATSNEHKLREIRHIIVKNVGGDVEVHSAPIRSKIEIQSEDLRKIVAYAASILMVMNKERPLLLEDSGLFINSLKGFPGPYSSYVYETIGPEGILKLMEKEPDRSAYFKCVAACVCEDDTIVTSEGVVYGEIATELRGSRGFGFDPIFVPKGYGKTFAELPENLKNEISHRARAFVNLLKKMREMGYL